MAILTFIFAGFALKQGEPQVEVTGKMPKLGQIAPDFSLLRDGGALVTLSSCRPKPVIVYFYPRDDTSGCTLEAQNFTENAAAFSDAGAVVLGISRDTVKSHEKFSAKYGLGVPLLSDEDGAVCEAYGVWVEKMNYGKKYMGIERRTFLISGEGVIMQIWNKVRVKGHVDAVLKSLQAL